MRGVKYLETKTSHDYGDASSSVACANGEEDDLDDVIQQLLSKQQVGNSGRCQCTRKRC